MIYTYNGALSGNPHRPQKTHPHHHEWEDEGSSQDSQDTIKAVSTWEWNQRVTKWNNHRKGFADVVDKSWKTFSRIKTEWTAKWQEE